MLDIQHLTRRYQNKLAVSDLSLTFETGKTYALLGPNGSGKTTLMKMIDGRILPDSGTVTIGQTIKIGYYTQEIETSKEAGLAYMDPEEKVIDYIKNTAEYVRAYEQANQQMESLSKQWQSEVEAKAQEAKTMYDEYQKNASNLSATQKTAQENAIIAKEKEAADLRKKYFGPEGEGMKKRQELITPIQDAIYNAIKDIATQKNYDAVIDRASAQSMIFASPRIDISNEVLAKLGYSN